MPRPKATGGIIGHFTTASADLYPDPGSRSGGCGPCGGRVWDEIAVMREAEESQRMWDVWVENGVDVDFTAEAPFRKALRSMPHKVAGLLNGEMERRGIHIRYGHPAEEAARQALVERVGALLDVPPEMLGDL